MSVEDELRWAEGHVEHLREERANSDALGAIEHIEGALSHLVVAVRELAAEVASMKGPPRRGVPAEDMLTRMHEEDLRG